MNTSCFASVKKAGEAGGATCADRDRLLGEKGTMPRLLEILLERHLIPGCPI